MEATMVEKVKARRQEAATKLGLEVSQVHIRRLEIAQMRDAGLLIDLDVHGISMFSTRVSFAELGIAQNDARCKRMRAGRKDLFPRISKKMQSLEVRARQNLKKNSHVVPVFGQYRWMPWTAYESFRDSHDAIVAEIETTKQEAIDTWDEVYEENREFFANVAENAWTAMVAQYAPGDEVMIVTQDHAPFSSKTGHDRFIEYVVQRALAKMPLPEEIQAMVKIDYSTSILYGESEVATEEAAIATAQAAQAEANALKVKADHEVWEVQHEEELLELSEKAKIEAFKTAEMEHARQQLAEMGSPIQDALDGLRATLYDAVGGLVAGLQKNGGFRGRASDRALELYNMWQELNGGLLKDDALEVALENLNAKMVSYKSASKDIRDTQIGDITSKLAEIATLTAESARKINEGGSSRAKALEF